MKQEIFGEYTVEINSKGFFQKAIVRPDGEAHVIFPEKHLDAWINHVNTGIAPSSESVRLIELRTEVIAFLRKHFFTDGAAASLRRIVNETKLQSVKQFYELFGSGEYICRLAGLPNADDCI